MQRSGDINADDVARLLIDNRIDRDGGFANGAVADDELALAAAEGKERINDDDTGLKRLGYEIPINDCRCRALDRFQHICGGGLFPVERASKWIDDTAEQRRSHRHAHHITGTVHSVTGLDRIYIVQQDTADMVAFEHLDEAELSIVEAQKLIEPNIG